MNKNRSQYSKRTTMNTAIERAQEILDRQDRSPLQGLVEVLEKQKKVKQDLVVPSGHIRYDAVSGLLHVLDSEYSISDLAHDQIGQKLEIPAAYYRKLRTTYPELLASNINMWLSKKEQTKYLLRTFNYGEEGTENICRAMLSNKYNILDNYDVLIAALEAIRNAGIDVEIVKAEVTDKRMYLHVVAPQIHIEATELLDGYLADRANAVTGNGIISGLVISNSEVGLSGFEISARAQILKCKNGMHDRMARFRKVHLGGVMNDGIVEWSGNTINKNYELIMSQIHDSVKLYLSKEYLGQLTTKLQRAKDILIENEVAIIENVSNAINIPEQYRQNILRYFLKDGDNSAFGVYNAITRESQKMSPDMQFEIESDAFEILPKMKSFDKIISKN